MGFDYDDDHDDGHRAIAQSAARRKPRDWLVIGCGTAFGGRMLHWAFESTQAGAPCPVAAVDDCADLAKLRWWWWRRRWRRWWWTKQSRTVDHVPEPSEGRGWIADLPWHHCQRNKLHEYFDSDIRWRRRGGVREPNSNVDHSVDKPIGDGGATSGGCDEPGSRRRSFERSQFCGNHWDTYWQFQHYYNGHRGWIYAHHALLSVHAVNGRFRALHQPRAPCLALATRETWDTRSMAKLHILQSPLKSMGGAWCTIDLHPSPHP